MTGTTLARCRAALDGERRGDAANLAGALRLLVVLDEVGGVEDVVAIVNDEGDLRHVRLEGLLDLKRVLRQIRAPNIVIVQPLKAKATS